MVPSRVILFFEHRPAADATLALLVLALLATLVLSRIIKRRDAAQAAAAQPPQRPAIQAQRIQRATSPSLPQDVQERLRLLTADIDKAFASAASAGPRQGVADASSRDRPAGPSAANGPPDDATHFFGDDVDADNLRDNTASLRGDPIDSATRFFGAETESGGDDDATRFFGGDEADAGEFFGADSEPTGAAAAEQDDVTRFFGGEDDAGEPAPFSETQLFAPEELDRVESTPSLVAEGHTGMLDALPPAAREGLERGDDDRPGGPDEQVAGTGPLGALPPSQTRIDTEALDAVRERLASMAVPEVIALSVLDAAGRVLAGDADDDLAGELRSLMAESGAGNTADLEQPVRLDDDSNGALLLRPTGANALLGALVREADDPQATRARLRGLAHEIGDAMRRAS